MSTVANEIVKGDVKYHRLSHAAYKEDRVAKIMAADVEFDLIAHLSDRISGADVMIFQSFSSREVVIAFRGTGKNYADIVTDLKFRKENMALFGDKEIMVHRGFLAQWRGIRDQIHDKLSERNLTKCRISVTGHSLGGAVAVQAALEWSWIDELVTFGAPRVSTRRIKKLMAMRAKRHRRYVFGADIVPIVPLLLMGFRHDCRPIYLTRGNIAILDCSLWREMLGRGRSLISLSWSKSWSWCPVPTRLFTDHRITDYEMAMQRASQ